MATIHFIGGEKGGVGKSLTSRVLAQYMIDRNIPFLGFDTDRSHGALMRFYSGYASPVVMDRYEALDVIVEAAAEQPERRILVDLAAQTHEPLVKWMDDAGVIGMAEEMGMTIHYWHVMDAGKDSVDLLQKLLDRFGTGLKYVLVRNQIRGNDFSVLEQSGQQQRAARARREDRLDEEAARRRDPEDRRRQQQLLEGQERAGAEQRRPRPDGPSARQDVAARCVPRDRRCRRLGHAPSARLLGSW